LTNSVPSEDMAGSLPPFFFSHSLWYGSSGCFFTVLPAARLKALDQETPSPISRPLKWQLTDFFYLVDLPTSQIIGLVSLCVWRLSTTSPSFYHFLLRSPFLLHVLPPQETQIRELPFFPEYAVSLLFFKEFFHLLPVFKPMFYTCRQTPSWIGMTLISRSSLVYVPLPVTIVFPLDSFLLKKVQSNYLIHRPPDLLLLLYR